MGLELSYGIRFLIFTFLQKELLPSTSRDIFNTTVVAYHNDRLLMVYFQCFKGHII